MFRGDLIGELVQAKPRAFQLLWVAMEDCQGSGVAPAGDLQPLVLTAWSAVHGLATLWIDGALPYKNLDPERLAPKVSDLLSHMFAALARNPSSRSRSSSRRRAVRS